SRDAVRRYFTDALPGVKGVALRDAIAKEEGQPLVAYLLGRRLHGDGAHGDALVWLDAVLAAGDAVPPSIRREALRLAIESAYGADKCLRVRELAREATTYGTAFARRAGDWVARCEHDETAK
ncbi:MAG: hypothetical protein HY906_05745, partial [Deltaproteobacteria bacterium]|nr:hypothetical protein [Deltaproteobacteria bacterium]